jgi:hypothetical protein
LLSWLFFSHHALDGTLISSCIAIGVLFTHVLFLSFLNTFILLFGNMSLRISTCFTPIVYRSLSSIRYYHSAEFNGGNLVGRVNGYSFNSTKGPEDPLSHLEIAQLTDPRTVSELYNGIIA